jgi:iron-sulfur cluster repair protein YtfE (RIC family)
MSVASTDSFASVVTSAEFGVHVADPIEHLLHCHERIERSLITIQNAVASLRLTDPVLRTEAAAALDYELSTLQLLTKLHIQDEEQSLFPRLRARLRDDSGALTALLPELESHHRENENIFRELANCIRKLSTESGQQADAQLSRLETLVTKLENLHRPHMKLEVEQVLANCRQYLTETDLAAMQKEMRQRFIR